LDARGIIYGVDLYFFINITNLYKFIIITDMNKFNN